MIREIKNKSSKFDGIIYVQAETHADYPDPEITETHSRQITQRMTPGELDRRLTFVYDESGPILPEVLDKVVERISEGIPNPPHIAIGSNPVNESPEEWEGLVWDELPSRGSLSVDLRLIDYIIENPRRLPCKIGTYDDFNFKDKLTIRLGRITEYKWVWQILAQDERFRAGVGTWIDYGNIRSAACPGIYNLQICLRGTDWRDDNNIRYFTADAERMHEIFSQLHDWSINWEGFAG
jgi:hypothetical protein